MHIKVHDDGGERCVWHPAGVSWQRWGRRSTLDLQLFCFCGVTVEERLTIDMVQQQELVLQLESPLNPYY